MSAIPDIIVYKLSSPVVQSQQDRLAYYINKGYDVPRYQYNIITTSRIQGTLQESFSIENLDDAYMAVLLAPKDLEGIDNDSNVRLEDDGHATKAKLVQRYSKVGIDVSQWNITLDKSVDPIQPQVDLPEDGELLNRFLGMACLKPHAGSYEITGFLSVYPKAGSLLMKFCDYWVSEKLGKSEIWLTINGCNQRSDRVFER